MRLLGHLEIVVVEADRREAGGDEQHDPDIGAFEVRPQQRRGEQAEEDHQAAHRRRALLGQKVRSRPVGADRLALALLQAQRRDDHRPEEEDEQQPGRRRAERAEGQIAEEVEDARDVRKIGQPGQHRGFLTSRFGGRESFAQGRHHRPHAAAVRSLDHDDVAAAQSVGEFGEECRSTAQPRRRASAPARRRRARGSAGRRRTAGRPGSARVPGRAPRACPRRRGRARACRRSPRCAVPRRPARRRRAAPARRASRRDWRCSSRR